jgi:hypothetical protein
MIVVPVAWIALMVAIRTLHSPSVQKQELRCGRQRAGQLQALAVEKAQRPSHDIGLPQKVGLQEDARAIVDHLGLASAPAESGGGQEILEHRQSLKGLRDLKAAADSHAHPLHRRSAGHIAPEQFDAARMREEIASDQIEEGRLARAIWADDAQGLPARDCEGHGIRDLQGAE